MIEPIVQDPVDRIVRYYNPDRVILFGSYARGNPSQFSDIDLLIIKDTGLPMSRRYLELRHLFYNYPVRVDLMIYTNEEFEDELGQEYSFLSSISKAWIEIYNRAASQVKLSEERAN